MSREPRNVRDVVVSGLCSGCGLCASLSDGRIRMGINVEGMMRPFEFDPVDDETNQRILKVCPGVAVTGPERSGQAEMHPVWGPIRALWRSWSAEPTVRRHGAAGGTLSGLARFLLSSGEVDAVLQVRASSEHPWLTDAVVSRTPDDALAGAQSRYGPSAPLGSVKSLLDAGMTFAVIAKPCDIAAIRALSRLDARVARQIPYLLTFFCGGVHGESVPKAIMRFHRVSQAEIDVFRYRGDGWPGPTRVQTKAGVRHDLTYEEAWMQPRPWRYDTQFRCKVCPDTVGELADVTAPDGWLVDGGKVLHDEAPGVNFALARTRRGEELIRRAADAGFLELGPLAVSELETVHSDHLPRKLGWCGALLAMRAMRQPTLRVRGFRPLRTVRRAGLRRILAQATGTVRRVARGGNRETAI